MDILCGRFELLEKYINEGNILHPEGFMGYTLFTNFKQEEIARMFFPREICR
jgi:hypothetical protein